jgi:hypothetical protein
MTALDDLRVLTKDGNIGFYSRCEVTEICVHNKEDKKYSNLFTLLVFEDAEFSDFKGFLNPKPTPIRKHRNYSCGIFRYYTSVKEAITHFFDFSESKEWGLSGNSLSTSNSFVTLRKQYVPADDSYITTTLNSLLKNNFQHHGGSYIIECFDNSKAEVHFLLEDPTCLKELSSEIQRFVPLKIAKVSDRLGNIILQCPVTLLHLKTHSDSSQEVKAEGIWHPKVETLPPIEILSLRDFDNTLADFKLSPSNLEHQVHLGASLKGARHIIFRPDTQLILASSNNTVFLRGIDFQPSFGIHEPRIFPASYVRAENMKLKLSSPPERIRIGKSVSQDFTRWTKSRLYEQEIAEQEASLSFVQYGRRKGGKDRERAFNDIRALIQRHGAGGVYLWDPFLTGKDIMETLYFCTTHNVPLRAITSFDKEKREVYEQEEAELVGKLSFEDWKSSNASRLASTVTNNNFGVNLDFRVQHSEYGWKFHDRFLIFPNVHEGDSIAGKVRVWSLGTSINSLGKKHHILQEISNSRSLLDAFNELWNELIHPSCIIWQHYEQ